jgi:acetyl-CoA carboxylase biotin carboxylase subunit
VALAKVLIANRGEIVLRVAKACRKLDFEPYGIYSEADKESLHLKYCKAAVNIGGYLPSESYLCMDKIIDAAKKLGCDLVHPGYGFLAENSEFAGLCKKEGLIFVGPSSSTLELSGDKAKAREIGSTIAPVLEGKEVSTEREGLDLAMKIGYPVILKAVKGGGGRGLRIVESPEGLIQEYNASKKEAALGFGSNRVYIEKYLKNPRHIEVQVLADHINTIHLGERECSVQRRHQKLIEETPSPGISQNVREKMTQTAIDIMKKIKYTNAGTVEFLFRDGHFYFMEVNARIQVEHGITEEVTGIDIVEQQLRIASDKELQIKQDDITWRGHAMECRINAEHPITFAPFSGTIKKFDPPAGEDIRLDTALYSGYSIPPFYDSLIAKLICHTNSRLDTIEKMENSLSAFRISGIPSTIPFQISALHDSRFVEGNYDTSFINELRPFSSRDGEIAAAILSQVPKRMQILKKDKSRDPWLESGRYDGIQFYGMHDDYYYDNSRLGWRK